LAKIDETIEHQTNGSESPSPVRGVGQVAEISERGPASRSSVVRPRGAKVDQVSANLQLHPHPPMARFWAVHHGRCSILNDRSFDCF
jgi:hypothetical protein